MNLREQANQASIAEAARIIGVTYESLHAAVRKGTVKASKKRVVVKKIVRVVDLEDVEAWNAARKRALESKDKYELARIRGIKVRSAERAIRRANKNC